MADGDGGSTADVPGDEDGEQDWVRVWFGLPPDQLKGDALVTISWSMMAAPAAVLTIPRADYLQAARDARQLE
jgi:hypothetical protein